MVINLNTSSCEKLSSLLFIYETLCTIWSFLHNLKNAKNTYGRVILSKSSTPPWVFFTFFTLRKWYQIAQSITYLKQQERNMINQSMDAFFQLRREGYSLKLILNIVIAKLKLSAVIKVISG